MRDNVVQTSQYMCVLVQKLCWSLCFGAAMCLCASSMHACSCRKWWHCDFTSWIASTCASFTVRLVMMCSYGPSAPHLVAHCLAIVQSGTLISSLFHNHQLQMFRLAGSSAFRKDWLTPALWLSSGENDESHWSKEIYRVFVSMCPWIESS